jgi:acyl-CoA thioesterase-2
MSILFRYVGKIGSERNLNAHQPPAPTGPPAAQPELADLLRLIDRADGCKVGVAPTSAQNNAGNVFGGLLLGQAVVAAQPPADRPLHMLAASFLRGASPSLPIEYPVCEAHDGGSFSSRRVLAMQDGRRLAEFSASYQACEAGLDHEDAVRLPDAGPEELPTLAEATAGLEHLPPSTLRALARDRALEIRPIDPEPIVSPGSGKPIRLWIRTRVPISERRELWAPAIAYLSDFLTAGGGVSHHTFVHNPRFFGTTLNHTLWLHREADPSEWLLHDIASHWTGGGRTLNLTRLYTRQGALIATSAQEALLRRRAPKPETAA